MKVNSLESVGAMADNVEYPVGFLHVAPGEKGCPWQTRACSRAHAYDPPSSPSRLYSQSQLWLPGSTSDGEWKQLVTNRAST